MIVICRRRTRVFARRHCRARMQTIFSTTLTKTQNTIVSITHRSDRASSCARANALAAVRAPHVPANRQQRPSAAMACKTYLNHIAHELFSLHSLVLLLLSYYMLLNSDAAFSRMGGGRGGGRCASTSRAGGNCGGGGRCAAPATARNCAAAATARKCAASATARNCATAATSAGNCAASATSAGNCAAAATSSNKRILKHRFTTIETKNITSEVLPRRRSVELAIHTRDDRARGNARKNVPPLAHAGARLRQRHLDGQLLVCTFW